MRVHSDGGAYLGMRAGDRERCRARRDVLAAGDDAGHTRVARTRKDRVEVPGEPRIAQVRVRIYEDAFAASRRGNSGGPACTFRPGSSRPHFATSAHGADSGDGSPS